MRSHNNYLPSYRLVLLLAALLVPFVRPATGTDVSFRAREEYRTGIQPQLAAIADLNGDGFKDLLLVEAGNRLRLLPGDMHGRFHSASLYPLPCEVAAQALVFPRTGAPGMVLALRTMTGNQILLIDAEGKGNFSNPRLIRLPDTLQEGLSGWAIHHDRESNRTVAALDSTGKDLWILDVDVEGGAITCRSRQSLEEAASQLASIDPGVSSIGRIALLSEDGLKISIASWNGDRFSGLESFPLDEKAASMASGAQNGRDFLFVALESARGLLAFADDGSGLSASPARISLDVETGAVMASDLNRDGQPDLVFASPERRFISVLRADKEGFWSHPGIAVSQDMRKLLARDVDGDGHLDLLALSADGGDYEILAGDGSGAFKPSGRSMNDMPESGMADTGGTNASQTGESPAIEVHRGSAAYAVVLNRRAGIVEITGISGGQPTRFAVGDAPSSLEVSDIDQDGLPDLLVTSEGSANVAILMADSAGWSEPRFFGTDRQPVSVTTGDFNEDGRIDIAALNLGSGTVSILLQEAIIAIPFGFIDSPATGTSVAGSISIAGWAAGGVPLATVTLLVDGLVAIPNIPLTLPRPDVCTVLPGYYPCPNVGFSANYNTDGLVAGTHTLTLQITDSNGTVGTGLNTVSIIKVPVDIRGNLEAPAAGLSFSGPFTVSGWTFANRGVQVVEVLVDGALMGNATYGLPRPDVCAAFPGVSGCANSGFNYTLNPSALSAGAHTLQIRTRDNAGATHVFPSPARGFSKPPNQILGNLESPTGNVPSGPSSLSIYGWALATQKVARVAVLVDGAEMANATYGQTRLDVCAALGAFPDCPNVGFSYLLDYYAGSQTERELPGVLSLAPGNHTLQLRVYDMAGMTLMLPPSGPISFTVAQRIIGAQIESPGNGETVSGVWAFRGWAGSSSSLVSQQLLIDGAVVANVPLGGIARQDVCVLYPFANCPNVGWLVEVNTADGSATTTTVPGSTTTTTFSFTTTTFSATTTTIASGTKPVITELQPSQVAAQTQVFLIVKGANFVDGSVILVSGTPLNTWFVSPDRIQGALFLPTPGTRKVVVRNPNGEVSNEVDLPVSPRPAQGEGLNGFSNGSIRLELANGPHVAVLRITDNGGRTYISPQVLFNVANVVTTTTTTTTIAGTSTTTTTIAGGTTTTTVAGLVPMILELNPPSAAAGGPPFVLGALGTGFANGAVLHFGGVARVTNVTNQGILAAIIPADAIATGGDREVKIINPNGNTSNVVTFPVTGGSGGTTTTTTTIPGGSTTTTTTSGTTTTTTLATGYPPIATGVSPSSLPVGSASQSIIVFGQRFDNTSRVLWDVQQLTVTARNTAGQFHSLTATVPASLLLVGGLHLIQVDNPAGSSNPGTSNAVEFYVTAAVTTTTIPTTTTTTTIAGSTTTSSTTTTTSGGGTTTTTSSVTTTTFGTGPLEWYTASPSILKLNGQSVTITITGLNFAPGMVAFVGDWYPVNVGSSTTGAFTIPGGDLAPDRFGPNPPANLIGYLVSGFRTSEYFSFALEK